MPTIIGPIVPGGSDYAGMDDLYLAGGFRVVTNLTDRDAIPTSRRKAGMEVYVQQTGVRYRLKTNLTEWETVLNANQEQGVIDLAAAGMGPSKTMSENSSVLKDVVNTAPAGSVLYLPPGRYLLDPNNPVQSSKTLHWRGVPGESWLVNGNPTSYGMNAIAYISSPSASNSLLLARSHFPGETQVELESVSGLSVGDWVVIRDNASKQQWHNDPAFDAWNEELLWIEEINGNLIKVHRPLVRRYLTGRDARVYRFAVAPTSPVIEGISWERCRVDIAYGVHVAFLNCLAVGSNWPSYSLRHCEFGYLRNCRTMTPKEKGIPTEGAAFYLHHSKFIQVDGHVAQQVEGAVLRRGTWYCTVTNSIFAGANTGLALYFGDCRYNVVSNCVFDRANLVWGGGGHFGDSYNASYDCVFRRSPERAIGAGNTAYRSLNVTYDGRAFKTSVEHGCDNGQPVVPGGTWPSPILEGKRYWMVAVTAKGGAWGNEFLMSDRRELGPVGSVDFSTTSRTVTLNLSWQDGDAVVFQGRTMPGGVDGNRIYFLKQVNPGEFYLQIRPGQMATFSNDEVTLAGAGAEDWQLGAPVMFLTTGTLPQEISAAPQVYYIVAKPANDRVKISGTPNGVPISFTNNGSGTHQIVVGITSAAGSVVSAEGGRPLAVTGSGTGMVIYTAGEGNTFDGHEIHDPPMNAVHIFRGSGMRFRNLRFLGAQDELDGVSCFVFGNCTDVDITQIWAENSVDAVNNRVLHSSGCYGIRLQRGRFDIPNSAGQLFTGGSSQDLQLRDLDFPATESRAGLVNVWMLPAVTGLSQIRLKNGQWTGRDGSYAIYVDVSVNHVLPGDTANILIFESDLTANRVVKLDNILARPGDWVRVVRLGGGLFTLTVQRESDNETLFTFGSGQKGWVEFDWDGSGWKRSGWNLE